MVTEHSNKYGTKFQCHNDTDIIADGSLYIYHIINRGGSGLLRDYVDCYHLTEAVASAAGFEEVIELLTNENLGVHASNYNFEVHLLGMDMLSDNNERLIMVATKSPI